jgi:putative transposase
VTSGAASPTCLRCHEGTRDSCPELVPTAGSRAPNLYAKLPERDRERVKHAYWQALDAAISEQDAKRRLQALVDDLDKGGFTAAAPASPTISTRSSCTCATQSGIVADGAARILLERSLGEVKPRTKVMGRFPGETSCLTLV